jgi:hypothetical protein
LYGAEKVIIFSNSSRDLAEFRTFAQQAARMKRHGRVQIDIGVLAQKATFELPPGGNDWHQYAAFNANLAKFLPHARIAPFYPAEWVARNRELLLGKAAILREFGLEAALSSNDTHYLPEAFFEKYPQLRGPRVDHPRRSRREEFTYCLDLAETREMIEWMTAEAKRQIPELKTILVHVNDSGTGLCWAENQYSGANGPEHCRRRSVGLRLRDLAEAYHRGAAKGGGEVDVRIGGQLTTPELDDIVRHLPPRTYLSGRDPLVVGGHGTSDRDPAAMGITTMVLETYPVLGLLNPLALLATMEQFADPQIRTFVFGTGLPWYYRADEPLETTAKLMEIAEASMAKPTRGLLPRFLKLRELTARWGGEKNADRLFDAFYLLDDAIRTKPQTGRYSTLYAGVSTRHITRPLLLRPEVLSPEEEAYFLPFIFNLSEAEARNDYTDIHGGRMTGPPWDDAGLQRFVSTINGIAATLEGMEDAPERAWLRQMGASLRMWMSVLQSVHHFVNGQRVRDARREQIAKGPREHFKDGPRAGDPEYFLWYRIQRQELDNTAELIRLLEKGGLRFFAHARRPEDEDTFLFGPDIVGALRQKRRLMRVHWLDAQKHLAAPLR